MLKNWRKIPTPLLTIACLLVFLPVVAYAQANAAEVWILKILHSTVFGFFSYLAGAAGTLLDWAINYLVTDFGKNYTESGLGNSIDRLWVIVRDLFNLTFIFGLVFIGLRLIFDSNSSSTRKMLVMLIMAALLVNFSLFITKFVVDFANIAAVQLVNTFPPGSNGKPSITEAIVTQLGLTTLFASGAEDEFFRAMGLGNGLTFIFISMILMLVCIFVFLAGSILLFIRFAVLNLYMLLSPLMFIGWVFPSLSSKTIQFWSGFLGQAFFAPAYILMLYFSFEIIKGFSTLAVFNAGSFKTMFASGVDPQKSIEAILPPFILAAIFLLASVVIGKSMGAIGASGAISIGNKIRGKIQSGAVNYSKRAAGGAINAATYLPKAGVRSGVNWAGNKGLKSFANWQANAQAAAGAAGAGRGAKLKGWVATRNVTDRAARGVTEKMKNAQLGTGTTNEAEKEYARKVQSGVNQTQAENNRAQDFTNSETALNDMTTSTANLTLALDSLAKTLQSMTKEEKTKLGINKLKNTHVAANLTDDDIDHFEKSGSFSAQQIQDIKDARKTGLTAIAAGGSTFASVNAAGNVTGYTHPNASAAGIGGAPVSLIDRRHKVVSQGTQNVGKMPISVFTQPSMYQYLSPAMVEERIKKGVSPSEKADMRTALEGYLGVGPGVLPSSVPALAGSPWTKWENSNSFHAADFFA